MTSSPLRLDRFLPYRLSYTSNLVSETIAGTYEALFGLSIPQWRIIAVVAEQAGITQQEIGARTRMDKVTVSRAAIALSDRGLLERRANAADRRSHLLVLSGLGEELYRSVAPKAKELEQRIFSAFDPAELERFERMLRRIDEVTLAVAAEGPSPSD